MSVEHCQLICVSVVPEADAVMLLWRGIRWHEKKKIHCLLFIRADAGTARAPLASRDKFSPGALCVLDAACATHNPEIVFLLLEYNFFLPSRLTAIYAAPQ